MLLATNLRLYCTDESRVLRPSYNLRYRIVVRFTHRYR